MMASKSVAAYSTERLVGMLDGLNRLQTLGVWTREMAADKLAIGRELEKREDRE